MSKTNCKKTSVFFYSAILLLVVLCICIGCKNAADGSDFSAPSASAECLYTQVPFGQNGAGLDSYLKNNASTETVYIEVTELTKNDLEAQENQTSKLAKILQKYPGKKIALKFGGAIENLTQMCYTFAGCTNLVEAPVIPESVKQLDGCFKGCTSLAKAPVIPGGVTDLDHCFEGCTTLTEMPLIPANVTDIRHCFKDCTALTKVSDISANVNVMESAFEGCTALKQGPEVPASDEMNINNCFKGCSSLVSVTLKCIYISDENFCFAFKGCSSLNEGGIKVPAGNLAEYKGKAGEMGTTEDKFSE